MVSNKLPLAEAEIIKEGRNKSINVVAVFFDGSLVQLRKICHPWGTAVTPL